MTKTLVDSSSSADLPGELSLSPEDVYEEVSDEIFATLLSQSSHILVIRLSELDAGEIDIFPDDRDEQPLEFHRYQFTVIEKRLERGSPCPSAILALDRADHTLETDTPYILLLEQLVEGSQAAWHFKVLGLIRDRNYPEATDSLVSQ